MHAETQIEKAQNFRKRLCRDVIHQGANHGMGGAIIFKVIILTNQSIYVTIRKWIIGEKTLMIVMESSLIHVEVKGVKVARRIFEKGKKTLLTAVWVGPSLGILAAGILNRAV